MKKIILGVLIALLMTCAAQAQQEVPSIGPTTSPLDLRTKINTALDVVRSNFSTISNNTIDLTVQEPLSFDPDTGVLSLSGGAGVEYRATDPAAPESGDAWFNYTSKQIKVADSLGIYVFNATSIAAWDTTPTAFTFTDLTNATVNSTYVSDPITIAGINWPAPISVGGDASAKYSINSANATAENGTVALGDEVRAVVTSSANASTAVNATVAIGGVSDAYSVTTAAEEGGGEVEAYIGWDNTDGVPSVNPSGSYSSQLLVYFQKWTATADGTLNTLNVYAGPYDLTPRAQRLGVYVEVNGTLTLKAQATYSVASTGGWTGAVELVAADGQTLDFYEGDILYFGGAAAASVTAGQTYGYGRETAGGTGSYRSTAIINVKTALPATISSVSLTASATTKVAGILGVLQ